MHIMNNKKVFLWNCSWLPYLCSYVYLFVTTAGLKIVIHWSSCWPKVQCWTIKQELNNSPFLSVNLFISTENWPHLWMEDMIYANRYKKPNPVFLNSQLNHHVWVTINGSSQPTALGIHVHADFYYSSCTFLPGTEPPPPLTTVQDKFVHNIYFNVHNYNTSILCLNCMILFFSNQVKIRWDI